MNSDLFWHWMLPLALVAVVALCAIVRFPHQRRWLRPVAATAIVAMVSLLGGEIGATRAIVIAGVILVICNAAMARR